MTDDHLEDALRGRFQRLKSEESGTAPDFAVMYARAEAEAGSLDAGGSPILPFARPRRPLTALTLAAGTLAAAVLAGILLLQPDTQDREFEALVTAFALESAGWRTPTDELLRVPGMEMLRSVPTVGWPRGVVPEGSEDTGTDTDVMG